MSPARVTAWLSRSDTFPAVILAVVLALANGVWDLLDHSVPSWDQSYYLNTTWRYQQALDHHGPIALLRALYAAAPSHPPLFTLLMLPFGYVFGVSSSDALMLNLLLAPVLYLSTGAVATRIFHDRRAGLLAICLVAVMPLMIGLDHSVLEDFLLTTLVAVSVLVLLKSQGFSRRGVTIGLGAVMALGTLTKLTFPIYLAGPLLVVGVQALSARRRYAAESGDRGPGGPARAERRRVAVNIAAMTSVYLVLVLPWYVPNLRQTLTYFRSATSGPLSHGLGPADPDTFHNVFAFAMATMNYHVSWIIGLAGLAAAIGCLPRFVSWMRRPSQLAQRLYDAALLVTWIVPAFLSVALGHNHDVRLMAGAMPGIAVVIAGMAFAIEWRAVRVGLIALTLVAATYQLVRLITPLSLGLPQQVSLSVDSVPVVIPLGTESMFYDMLPRPDYVTPVISYVESVVRSPSYERAVYGPKPRHRRHRTTLCLLESDPIVNGNTFRFLLDSRSDPYLLKGVRVGAGKRPLVGQLHSCDIALYEPRLPSTVRFKVRDELVNDDSAARFMTPALVGIFRGPRRSFPVGGGQFVEVLVRRWAPAPT